MCYAPSLVIGLVFGAISFIDPLSGAAIVAMSLLFDLFMFDLSFFMLSELMSIDYKLWLTDIYNYDNNESIATKQH